VIIEFAGPPGAGKSTIASHLLSLVESQSEQIIYRKDLEVFYEEARFGMQAKTPAIEAVARGFFCLDVGLRNISFILARWPEMVFKSSFVSPHYWLAKDLLLSKFYLAAYSKGQNETCPYWPEEGLIQHSVGAEVFGGGGLDRVKVLYSKSKLFDMLIILSVKISIDEGFERFWKRGVPDSWPGKMKRDKDKVFQIYISFYEFIEQVLNVYANEGVKIIPVDVSGECKDFVKKAEGIYQKLSPFLKHSNSSV